MGIHNHVEADTKADLYATIPGDGSAITLMGNTTRGDINPLIFMYDDNSSVADNYPLVVRPTLQTGNGRWLLKMLEQVRADWNEASSSGLGYIANKPSIPAAQIQSDWAQANGAAIDFIKNKPSLPSSPSAAPVTRSFNSAFQPSATNPVTVYYSISIQVTSTLLGTNSGTVSLQTSPHSAGTWTTVNQIALSVAGVASTEIVTQVISGFVSAGLDVRLLTATAGANGATITYITGQEVTL